MLTITAAWVNDLFNRFQTLSYHEPQECDLWRKHSIYRTTEQLFKCAGKPLPFPLAIVRFQTEQCEKKTSLLKCGCQSDRI